MPVNDPGPGSKGHRCTNLYIVVEPLIDCCSSGIAVGIGVAGTGVNVGVGTGVGIGVGGTVGIGVTVTTGFGVGVGVTDGLGVGVGGAVGMFAADRSGAEGDTTRANVPAADASTAHDKAERFM